jgi:tetratricopeptide (TPR) repeat protein
VKRQIKSKIMMFFLAIVLSKQASETIPNEISSLSKKLVLQYLQRGYSFLENGQFKQAEEDFKRVLSIYPDEQLAKIGLEEAQDGKGERKRKETEKEGRNLREGKEVEREKEKEREGQSEAEDGESRGEAIEEKGLRILKKESQRGTETEESQSLLYDMIYFPFEQIFNFRKQWYRLKCRNLKRLEKYNDKFEPNSLTRNIIDKYIDYLNETCPNEATKGPRSEGKQTK